MAIWTDIIATLTTKIDGMTTGTGFNFNYDNVDERRPANKTYPNTLIEYLEEVIREPLGNVVDSYSADREISFITEVDDSITPVDTALNNVQEDFKRLFEEIHAALQLDGLIVDTLLSTEREYTHVRERPGKIRITSSYFYRVRRSDPSLTI